MLLFVILLVFIGLAVGLAWYFISHDRGEKEPIGALWAVTGFGLLGGLAAGLLESLLLGPSADQTGVVSGSLLLSMLGVGIIEEGLKFIPTALFLYKKRYFNEHTDGIIYFALAGLGFGLPENIMYSLQFGAQAGVFRLFLTPFFHAATTSLVGYFLIKGKLNKNGWKLAILPLAAAMLLHGLYDFGLSTGNGLLVLVSLLITLGFTINLFLLYARATAMDQARGLSAVGKNSFCRTCGWPNPNHNLYCAHCGQYA